MSRPCPLKLVLCHVLERLGLDHATSRTAVPPRHRCSYRSRRMRSSERNKIQLVWTLYFLFLAANCLTAVPYCNACQHSASSGATVFTPMPNPAKSRSIFLIRMNRFCYIQLKAIRNRPSTRPAEDSSGWILLTVLPGSSQLDVTMLVPRLTYFRC
jgi:hypothetical protein